MKNILRISLVLLLFATSCVSKKSADRIQADKDSLALELGIKDEALNDIFVSMSAIVDNLEAIKSRENIISGNISNGEIPKQHTTTISEDIQAIDRLLQENRQTIEALNKDVARLNAANIKIAGLEKLSAQLLEQIEQKDIEIEELKNTLSTMNIKVEELNTQVAELETVVEDLNVVNAGLSGEIKAQEELLNTCYYIVGSEKELLAQNIIYKSGFIGRTLKINENHSLDTYTKINMSTVDNIYVGHAKAELVSTHPEDSYTIVMGANNVVEAIDIVDKDLFWSTSKVLLISYK